MRLSAGALACVQDDGCFTLVCGDSSLCLCLTKCQQVSYSKIWQERRRVWLHILQLPYCVTDLHMRQSHCNAPVSAWHLETGCHVIRTVSPTWLTNYDWELKMYLLSSLCKNPSFGFIVGPAFRCVFEAVVTIKALNVLVTDLHLHAGL